jgi:hypothetical protein
VDVTSNPIFTTRFGRAYAFDNGPLDSRLCLWRRAMQPFMARNPALTPSEGLDFPRPVERPVERPSTLGNRCIGFPFDGRGAVLRETPVSLHRTRYREICRPAAPRSRLRPCQLCTRHEKSNPSTDAVFKALLTSNARQCWGFAFWCSSGARLQSATLLSTRAIENCRQHLWPCELRTALSIFLIRDGP